MALGIATVYQEPQLFPELTVSENIFTGREIRRGGRIAWAEQNAKVVELLELLGLPARYATVPVGTLSIAEQQQVSIAKALAGEATVLILDEPSAILTDAEIEVLFEVVRRLTASGVAVVYISHRLDELFRIADEVTVMRDGQTIGTYPIGELSVRKVAELMVGGILSDERPHREIPGRPARARARRARSRGQVRRRERRGPARARSSASTGSSAPASRRSPPASTGSTAPTQRRDAARTASRSRRARPRQAQRLGHRAAAGEPQARGHVRLPVDRVQHLRRAPQAAVALRHAASTGRASARSPTDMIKRLAVRTPHERQPISAMSGGNAQKVVLARQLVERPEVLVLAEPTQGVDVGAKEEIHRIITELAENGTAVLVVTSDLPEALRISDRLQVVRGGTTTVEFGPDATQVDVLAAAAGAEHDRRPARDTAGEKR